MQWDEQSRGCCEAEIGGALYGKAVNGWWTEGRGRVGGGRWACAQRGSGEGNGEGKGEGAARARARARTRARAREREKERRGAMGEGRGVRGEGRGAMGDMGDGQWAVSKS